MYRVGSVSKLFTDLAVMRLVEEGKVDLDAPVTRVTGKDVPMPYAANLEKLALPSVADVVAAAKAVCYR